MRLSYVWPVIFLQSEIAAASIGHNICKKAEEVDAACVIMASHNRGSIHEFFLGSVTSYCLHNSKRPLLVIRHPMAEADPAE